jgi:hypothetical protein
MSNGWFDIASDRQCKDPRDRVFSILGQLPTSLTQRIHTSYSLPAGQIYAQAFVETITATKRLRLLGYLAHGASVECQPSWAPDLTRSRDDNFCEGAFSCATGHSAAHVTFELTDELHVRGITTKSKPSALPQMPTSDRITEHFTISSQAISQIWPTKRISALSHGYILEAMYASDGKLTCQCTLCIRPLAVHDCQFLNSKTGKETSHDPRLAPLPEEWKEIE